MKNELKTISVFFNQKLFRIPDYQRGYSWKEKQLNEFWLDIMLLERKKKHYYGVFTIEEVLEDDYNKWEDDTWIINDRDFKPYYVVDGQQRMTTLLILIQAIIESLKKENITTLSSYSIHSLIEKYIYCESSGISSSSSCIFGYHKDNPSYEYLKTHIFKLSFNKAYIDGETLYTLNLTKAKEYFKTKLAKLNLGQKTEIFKKITNQFVFNVNEMSKELDSHVAFEVMNNRGKKLSSLELLKNRLLFLSTKFDIDENKRKGLSRRIHNCWKNVYFFLGKNKNMPLDDNDLLKNHFLISFLKEGNDSDKKFKTWYNSDNTSFIKELLEMQFSIRNIPNLKLPITLLEESTEQEKITIEQIISYVKSLEDFAKAWYNIFNPLENKSIDDNEKKWLDKVERIKFNHFKLLLVALYQKETEYPEKRIKIIKVIERFKFLYLLLGYNYIANLLSNIKFELCLLASKFYRDKINADDVLDQLQKYNKKVTLDKDAFIKKVKEQFNNNKKRDMFYQWSGICYFLYEYEMYLNNKNNFAVTNKIIWQNFLKEQQGIITIEHIYPQNSKSRYWQENFSNKLGDANKRKLKHSLGNLLALSKSKNILLSNKGFEDKKKNYLYGSHSEIVVAQEKIWLPKTILERGLRMLNFMEKRWNISLGTKKDKIILLGLSFLETK